MADNKTDFQWKQRIEVAKDILNSEKIQASQHRIMKKFFESKSYAKNLVAWNEHYRFEDLPLYAAFGLIEPEEYEALSHYMERWQEDLIAQQLRDPTISEEDEVAPSAISVPPKMVSVLVKHLVEQDFDTYINLCMRLAKPIKLVEGLTAALYMEAVRTDPKRKVSAIDELVCQSEYPVGEDVAWVWMNKMAIGKSSSPLKAKLVKTSATLKKLNDFRLYKALAEVHDYGLKPVAAQYIDGELEQCLFQRKQVRVRAALDYLIAAKLVDSELYQRMIRLSPKLRESKLLELKREAVSACLSDLMQIAPDPIWTRKLLSGFGKYFQSILQQVGQPILSVQQAPSKGKGKRINFTTTVEVSFASANRQKQQNKTAALSGGNDGYSY